MAQQVIDVDTIGCRSGELGSFFDFYVNNVFYLMAPQYYYPLYSIYLNRCISVYDGWVNYYHNKQNGLLPQKLLQSVATGLNNMLFAHGIDFNGEVGDYNFIKEWARDTKYYQVLKRAHKYAIAGGMSLIKLNRKNKQLYVSAHRIDTFFPDFDGSGKVVSVKVFFDAVHNINPSGTDCHYGICEERYFNEENKPCVKASVYRVSGNIQTSVAERERVQSTQVNWQNLPNNVKSYIKENYPDIIIGEEQYLPFSNSIGCNIIRFTDDLPCLPNLPFGQPIGDILWTESFQYDQMKYFEKNEVFLARARALIPEEMWNKDDPDFDMSALSERYYQKVPSLNGDSDKVTPIQFMLRGNDIRQQKENIYKDIALKLNVSASSVASFLSEGAGSRTATEIISEKTKSDTWCFSQINLNADEINQQLKEIMYFYNHNAVQIVFKVENQSPFLEKLKTTSDVFVTGMMSPERYVKENYTNLSQEEQEKEIEYLKAEKQRKIEYENATMQSWNK